MTVKELSKILRNADPNATVEVLVGDKEVGYFGTNDIEVEKMDGTKKTKPILFIKSIAHVVHTPGEMPR